MPKRRPTVIDEHVQEQLRQAIEHSPLSVTWLARQLGRDRTTIYKWLDGTNAIPPTLLQRLCALLDLPKEQRVKQFAGRGYAIPCGLLEPVYHTRAPVGDFVGRAYELNQLVIALDAATNHGTAAAITGVRGMGGIGKTELALMAAQQLVSRFPDGQVVVDLHGAGSNPIAPAYALQTILRAFDPNTKLPDDLGELQGRYRARLHGKRILILADDAHDAAQVRPLLPPPGSALLITSRQRFALPGMIGIDLGGLPVEEAEQLLRAICPRIGAAAPELARLCGYLPLALRISASLLASNDTYSVARYLAQLAAERLKYLRDPDAPDDPSASVEASLALSYDALDLAAQTALCRLSVFGGDFDLPAAMAVLAPAAGVAEVWLGQLRRRNLLEWDAGCARYRLHDLVREFASARLTDAPAAQRRHAEHFLQLAEQSSGASEGAWRPSWLEQMEQEYVNFGRALDWLTQSEQWAPALRLAAALGPFWMGRDHIEEGSRRLETALAQLSAGQENIRAQALAHLGALRRVQGRLDAARRAYEESRVLFQWLEEEESYADVVFKLGLVISDQGEKLAARDYFEESLTYFRRHNRSNRIAAVLSSLGRTALYVGDYPAAQHYYTESYTLVRATGDREELGWLFVNLARLASIQNNYDIALKHIDQSLDYFTELGHSQGRGWALLRKGDILTNQADYMAAYTCLSETLALFEKLRNTVGSAMACHGLAHLALAQADEHGAWHYARSCLNRFHALQNKLGIGMGIELVARMVISRDAALATQLFGATEALRQSIGVGLEPADRAWHADAVATARAQLTDSAFTSAWSAGRGLPLEQAILLALQARAAPSGPARA